MKPYPSGCYTQFESNVGWYPFRLLRATSLRTGPGEQFPVKVKLAERSRVGRQSVRNPGASTTPEMRGGRDGFCWVYTLNGGDAGWVQETLLVPDVGGWADGPASVDFEVGSAPGVAHAPRPKKKPRFRLGWPVGGERIVQSREAYLRYAPHGTGIHYLLAGDRVERRWRHPRSYVCVRVLKSQTVPAGTAGWVYGRALKKP